MNDVRNFIDKFRGRESAEAVFSGDCSYWFAAILYYRFIREGAKIMYQPTTNRFCTMICGNLYYIGGIIADKRGWVPWLSINDKFVKETVADKYIMF